MAHPSDTAPTARAPRTVPDTTTPHVSMVPARGQPVQAPASTQVRDYAPDDGPSPDDGALRALLRRLLHLLTLMLPVGLQRKLAGWRGRPFSPPVLYARFGDLRRTQPISRSSGHDRGTPVDRHYIEQYLARRAEDIQGRVLEIADNTYTQRFGGQRVTQSDILHVDAGPPASLCADDALTDDAPLPRNAFDCIVLTHTLQTTYDVRTAITTLHGLLKPGGVLLATFPGIGSAGEGGYWTFTRRSARRLFAEAFPPPHITIEGFGNVLTTTALLQGLAAEELDDHELDTHDPDYATLLAVRAQRPLRAAPPPATERRDRARAEPATRTTALRSAHETLHENGHVDP